MKPALCKGFGSSGATQMNDRSKFMHMLRGKPGSAGEDARKITVQINRLALGDRRLEQLGSYCLEGLESAAFVRLNQPRVPRHVGSPSLRNV